MLVNVKTEVGSLNAEYVRKLYGFLDGLYGALRDCNVDGTVELSWTKNTILLINGKNSLKFNYITRRVENCSGVFETIDSDVWVKVLSRTVSNLITGVLLPLDWIIIHFTGGGIEQGRLFEVVEVGFTGLMVELY